MQSQSPIKTLDDDISKTIKKALQTIFDDIYKAVKSRNIYTLAEISGSYLVNHDDKKSAFSININGETPLSLISLEDDDKSRNFFLSRHVQTSEMLLGFLYRNDPNDLNLSPVILSPHLPNFLLLIAEKLSLYSTQNEKNRYELLFNKIKNKNLMTIYVEAMLGHFETVSDLILKTTDLSKDYLECTVLPNVSYCYGVKGHDRAINLAWENGKNSTTIRANIIRGCLEGGYIRKFEELMSKDKDFDQATIFKKNPQQYNLISNYNNILHPQILYMVLSYINSEDLRKFLMDELFISNSFKINPVDYFRILNETRIINGYHQKYQLNFYQSAALLRQETLSWIVEGMKLVKQGKITADILVKILSFIINPSLSLSLSHSKLMDLFQKVTFMLNKNMLITDLDHLMKPDEKNILDETCAHQDENKFFDEIKKFKELSTQVKSQDDLRNLVKNRYRMFSETNLKASIEHNASLENSSEDQQKEEFGNFLSKYVNRL